MNGTDILAAIERAHEEVERVRVEVLEWGCTLWFPKDISVARQKTIRAGIDRADDGALMVSYILHEAQTEDGTPVFKVDAVSRATLEGKGGLRVITRIMTEIGGPEDPEDIKNA